MLDTIFLQIFDMTKVASLVILIVLLVRLCLKRAPKVISYALWAVVLFRLLCPVSIEAPISLIPQTEPTIQNYNLLNEPITPIAAIDAAGQAVGDVLNGGIGIQHVATTNYLEDGSRRIIFTDWNTVWILFTKFVWLGGMAALLIYSTVSLIRLKRRLLGAILLRDNIYLADHIDSPFVMGLIRPKIYLPSSLAEKERDYIILHEQHHIRRGDHVFKLLSFIALCLHCFNPLVWIAFILSGKDMEMSCDEAVLRKLGEEIRVDYSASLISLATGRRIIAGTPLAFGEGNTEGRIKNIAGWKKPAVWVIVVAVIVCVVVAVCLITNPINRDTMLLGAEYRIDEILYRTSEEYAHVDNDSPSICITADYCLWERNPNGEGWDFIGQMEPYTLDKKELAEYTAYDAGWVRRYNTGEITDSYILHLPEDEYKGMLYIALQTKRGDTLLGYGWEDLSERGEGPSDDTSFKWLCRLESTFNKDTSAGSFLDHSLAQAAGGDVYSFHTWTNTGKPGYITVGFCTGEGEFLPGGAVSMRIPKDMGFAVFYHNKDESGYRLLQCRVYEDASLAENGIFLCSDPAVLNLSGDPVPEQTYDVIFIHNKEIARVERVWEYADGTKKKQGDSYLNGQQMLLYSREYDKPGCRIWQYFYGEHGELIDYRSIARDGDAPTVRLWVDFSDTPEQWTKDTAHQITRPEFPGTVFTCTPDKITAEADGVTSVLITGMPILNAFFSDLNGDGFAEICTTVLFGSGIVDTHVVVYDYKNSREYTLWERVKTEFALRMQDGQLICDVWEFPEGEALDYCTLVIEGNELKTVSCAVEMTPTAANVSGAFDSYLYVPLDGANYRFERIETDPDSVTKDTLILSFTEKAFSSSTFWRVYSLREYPDCSVLLAESDNGYVQLYRHRPAKAVDPARLADAKKAGIVTMENGDVTFGQERWESFWKKTRKGEAAAVQIAHYYTLDEKNCDETYYEVYKEDYPSLFILHLSFDGKTYTVEWNEYGTVYTRSYKYLMRYEDTLPVTASAKKPRNAVRFVLTNDNSVTWDDIFRGMASSRMGDYIAHFSVYTDITDIE